MGLRFGGGGGIGEPSWRLPGGCELSRATRRFLVWSLDEPPDEIKQIGPSIATQPLSLDDRPHLPQALGHVLVDQDVVIFAPVPNLAGGPAHPALDHVLGVGAAA